jgi:hypothetical protein
MQLDKSHTSQRSEQTAQCLLGANQFGWTILLKYDEEEFNVAKIEECIQSNHVQDIDQWFTVDNPTAMGPMMPARMTLAEMYSEIQSKVKKVPRLRYRQLRIVSLRGSSRASAGQG